jgi:hypothetical protein
VGGEMSLGKGQGSPSPILGGGAWGWMRGCWLVGWMVWVYVFAALSCVLLWTEGRGLDGGVRYLGRDIGDEVR